MLCVLNSAIITLWTYIETHGVQVHLRELDVFEVFGHLSTFPQEQAIRHSPRNHEKKNQRGSKDKTTQLSTSTEAPCGDSRY